MKVIGYAEPHSPFQVKAGEKAQLQVNVEADEEDLHVTTLVLLGPDDTMIAVSGHSNDLVARALTQLSKENETLKKRVASLEALEEVVTQQAVRLNQT